MYAPLNIKTSNYLLKSMVQIKDLIKVAKDNNLKALGLADNNMYGSLEFYNLCLKNNIKPIIGLEVSIPDKILLYAKNYEGYQNLMKLTTISSETQIDIDILSKHSEGLICILPYTSRKHYQNLVKLYENFFIGYQNELEKSKIKSLNTVYIPEILCLNKEDEKYLKYLKAIKEGKLVTEINDDFQNKSLFPLKPLDPENTQKIIDLCNLKIKKYKDLLPIYETEEDSFTYLKKECLKGLKRIFGSSAPKAYATRLKYELSVINKMGFNNYFLIVADYINYAKTHNILVGPGRGSAAGSLVAYCLGITTIDPLKYNLLFERFLNPERVTMPDIDVDFEDTKREEVINYCVNKYGTKNVALIVTFGTLAAKQAIKDVARIFDIEPKKSDLLTKFMDANMSLKENLKLPKVQNFLNINPEFKKIYQIASKFEGLKRHTSLHAAGIVMSKETLDNYVPLDKTLSGMYVTEYDKDYLEDLGLLKMDFLGLRNLTVISKILSDIKDLTFDTIPEGDKDALNIFYNVDTVGIFQFESPGMVQFLRKFKPQNFEDIVAALALFRPGPMHSIDTYIKRRHGLEKITYLHKDLEKILKPTYGIIIYQEQIMQIANVMAGFTFAEADLLRRAMSKKKEDILLKEKDHFINGCTKKGYSQNLATEVYDLIFRFADYGFNRSHSVAYAMISYRMAYLKAHYPKLFMKNLLSLAINSETKTKEYIYECKNKKIYVSPPDINKSGLDYEIVDGQIIYPLTNIKNVGSASARQIVEERKKGKFKDIFDFVCRCYKNSVTSKTVESLILSGSFSSFAVNKRTLIENLEIILNYAEIGGLLGETLKPELTIMPEYSGEELMNFELESFGFYLTNHPITEYKLKTNSKVIELKDIKSYFDKIIEAIVIIDRIKEITTKKSEKMMFITASDELSKTDIVVFPRVYNVTEELNRGDIIYIKGKVERRYDEMQIIASNIKKLN